MFSCFQEIQSFHVFLFSGNTIGKPCLDQGPSLANFSRQPENVTLLECSCSEGNMDCPENAEGPEPPKIQLASYDILSNMTGRNLSDFLMKTRLKYYKRRYGGFEFGVMNPLKDINISQVETNLKMILEKLPLPENLEENPGFLASYLAGNLDDLVRTKLDNIRVWFNNKGWTSSVGYLNAANNLVLRASIQAQADSLDFDDFDDFKDPSEFGISIINHPMNFTEKQLNEKNIRLVGVSLLHAICIIFAMSFVPASFVVYLIDERVNKVKHLHFVSSVPPLTYWISGKI